jgi:hypothetical protein
VIALTLALAAATGGCGILTAFFQPSTVRVALVNDSDFDVSVVLILGENQDAPRELLEEIGDEERYTLKPGESIDFFRDCDEIQAVFVDNAEMMIVGQIGPEADSEVLRDGEDYDCGDTVEFRFDHSDLIVDFHVTTLVRS